MTWAPDYVTLQELKNYLRIGDTADDAFCALWITTASRNVDTWCHRQFGQVAAPEARTYWAEYDRVYGCSIAQIDDLQDVSGLAIVDGNGTAVTDWTLCPVNAVAKGRPHERIQVSTSGKIVPTARWGWTATPSSVKVGMLLQAGRLAKRRDSPFGIAGSPQQGSEIQLWAQLDVDFQTSLKPFRRDWWAA